VLPEILLRLKRAGLSSSSISVLVASGTHPSPGEGGLADLLGPLPDGVRAVVHDCRDSECLTAVGALSSGVELRLNRLVVDAELLVTLSAIRHHYIAGFGGGPKMLFPGVAGYEEIQTNHARVFRPDGVGGLERHPLCEPGILDGNPIAEEIAESGDLFAPDYSVCMVLGTDGRIAWAGGGPWQGAFLGAVDRVRAWYELAHPTDSKLVVASAGGHPSDSTLIQAHKALDAACRYAEQGGEVLLVAELGGGVGSDDMIPFLDDPRPSAITEKLASGWVQYGHTTLRIVEKTARYRVFLHSRLDTELARRLGFRPVTDPEIVIDRWRADYPGETVAVIRGAPVYPRTS
jgi:nickel-dependent lactate racemase